MTGEPQSVDWILARSRSWFGDVVRRRREAGDLPLEPAKVFQSGRSLFGVVEFSGGRWLVLAVDPALVAPPSQGDAR